MVMMEASGSMPDATDGFAFLDLGAELPSDVVGEITMMLSRESEDAGHFDEPRVWDEVSS
jgi:hypothetical protein